jgi:hypothetical protein
VQSNWLTVLILFDSLPPIFFFSIGSKTKRTFGKLYCLFEVALFSLCRRENTDVCPVIPF